MANPVRKSLATLLQGASVIDIRGDLDVAVSSITHDSRSVRPGSLFVAYRGVYQDVHRYIPDAITRGAVAVVVERSLDTLADQMDLQH